MAADDPTLLQRLTTWASELDLADVPDRVVGKATSQLVSTLAAVRAGAGHPMGVRLLQAFGPVLQPDPARSAYTMAALVPWLRLDDVAFAGHVSASTVTVPMAYAVARGSDGRQLLAAIIAANECAARITAATTLGPLRGQLAAHTHLVGAVAGRSHIEEVPADRWVAALGTALSLPTWPGMHGFMGSDANLLSAAVPVRTGLDACDAAAAGIAGPADVLEHPDGFLAHFADVPVPELVTAGLGRRWHTDTLSYRLHPGGPGLDAALDCTLELVAALGTVQPDDVEEVSVTTSLYGMLVESRAQPYLDGPRSPVSALVLSTPYALATALLTGTLTHDDYAEPAVHDPRRWQLAGKVRVVQDDGMTRESLLCAVPFGEALRHAGARATPWLRSLGGDWLVELVGDPGPPDTTLEAVERRLPARVTVRLRDGRSLTRERMVPVGGAGPGTAGTHADLAQEKFVSGGGDEQLARALGEVRDAGAAQVRRLLADALRPAAHPR